MYTITHIPTGRRGVIYLTEILANNLNRKMTSLLPILGWQRVRD
jgi:hypothetical protein